MPGKRTDYLLWHEYFMSITSLVALRSINNNYGACFIDKDKKILSIGINETPYNIRKNIEDNQFIINPISNALFHFKGRRREFEDGTLYVTKFSNYEESKQIVQAKIKEVFYLVKEKNPDVEYISNLILAYGNVKIKPYFENYSIGEYKHFLNELKTVIKKNIGKKEGSNLIDDEYFMGISILSALRSKDPSTQVGACLVNKQNQLLSVGYNGAPFGMDDSIIPWDSIGELTNDLITTKNPYIVHAEMNAFDNYRGNQSDLYQAKLYLTYSPCEECSKRISSSLLEKIIYLRKFKDTSKSDSWLNKSQTKNEPYYQDQTISKSDYLRIFDETTKVIKKI